MAGVGHDAEVLQGRARLEADPGGAPRRNPEAGPAAGSATSGWSGSSLARRRSRPWVHTLAPPAPVLPAVPSTGPISWSWKPAAKMSVAL